MTAEEIADMPAGTAMDDLIAERVMGWTKTYDESGRHWGFLQPERPGWKTGQVDSPAPKFSTDMAAAWQIALWLRERHGSFSMTAGIWWHCQREEMAEWGTADTPELAICRAALMEVSK